MEKAFSLVYSSLRTGMIDSVLTSAESTKNGKFWEVLGAFKPINYAFPLNMVTINNDYWKSLNKLSRTPCSRPPLKSKPASGRFRAAPRRLH